MDGLRASSRPEVHGRGIDWRRATRAHSRTAIAQKTRDCRADRLTLLRNACRAGPGLWTGPARAQGQGGGTSRDAPSALGSSPSLCQRPRWERCSTPRVGSITWLPPLRCVSGSPATAVAIQTNQKRGSARESAPPLARSRALELAALPRRRRTKQELFTLAGSGKRARLLLCPHVHTMLQQRRAHVGDQQIVSIGTCPSP